MKKGLIFDMDGVIVDTAKYHFECWKNVAHRLGMSFSYEDNEQLKGVSRAHSLDIILEMGGLTLSTAQKEQILIDKNEEYLEMVRDMDRSSVLPGVEQLISKAKEAGYRIALGSASKNARHILAAADITDWFEAVVDGNDVTHAKPDPEVFLTAAQLIECAPAECVVFEDSNAGVKAANTAGITSVGIGSPLYLSEAQYCFAGFEEIPDDFLQQLS